MILVYNKQGFDDTLLCLLNKQNENIEQEVETKNDFVMLKQNGDIIGINIKDARKKFKNLSVGVNLADEGHQEVIDYILKETGMAELPATLKQQFVIGDVKEKSAHPESDKLSVCQVDIGTTVLQIVCGAQNVTAGQKVVVAQIGSMMPNGLIIEASVLRKVDSLGMICSAKELNLPEQFQTPGILVLPDDAVVGMNFVRYFKKEMMEK